MKLVGTVINPYSNLLVARLADASASWDARQRHYDRAVSPIVDRGKSSATDATSLLVFIGRTGTGYVVGHEAGWTIASLAAKAKGWSAAHHPALAAAASSPLSTKAMHVGQLAIVSGRLLLLLGSAASPMRAVAGPLRDDLDAIGVSVATENGEYEVIEDDIELSGSYGIIERRVRIGRVTGRRPRSRRSGAARRRPERSRRRPFA